jgi:hypothetical protein
MKLELQTPEVEVLRRVLENYLPELKGTISNTENFDWRQDMKKDEEVIKSILQRWRRRGSMG